MGITGDWTGGSAAGYCSRPAGLFAAGVALAGLASDRAFAQAASPSYPFTLGVASGDPTPKGLRPVDSARARPARGRRRPAPRAVRGPLRARPRPRLPPHLRQGTTAAVPDEAHSVRVELDELPARPQPLVPLQGR